MKKYCAIVILTIFVLSLMGSVSPGISSYVKNLTGDKKYASTILPAPPETNSDKNLAKKDDL
jgi:hypothetical protein